MQIVQGNGHLRQFWFVMVRGRVLSWHGEVACGTTPDAAKEAADKILRKRRSAATIRARQKEKKNEG